MHSNPYRWHCSSHVCLLFDLVLSVENWYSVFVFFSHTIAGTYAFVHVCVKKLTENRIEKPTQRQTETESEREMMDR